MDITVETTNDTVHFHRNVEMRYNGRVYWLYRMVQAKGLTNMREEFVASYPVRNVERIYNG